MRRNNTMRKKIMAFALLITMLCNNSAVSAWAAAEEETQVVSSSENNEPSVDLPDAQEQHTEAGETMTGTESTDSDREQTEAADQGTDSSTDQSEAPQEDIPEVSPEEVIEIEDYIRENYGEEYVPLMNEKLEGDEIPGYEDPEEPNGSDNQFVVDLALSSNEHWWQNQDSFNAFRDNGYEFDGSDINSASGMSSKYIYLGWKYTNDIQTNIGSVITGIMIKIGKRVDYFEYNNKKYYPLSRLFRDSNGDLNQGAGGDYLYIYYTRDGAEKGDPVICTSNFGISTGRPSSGLLADGIDDNGSITKDMDINPKGDSTYLTYTYHYHNLAAVPKEDGHTLHCTSCNFHKAIEPHEYEYASISDSQHEGTCKVCKHKITVPHMDKDKNLKCDDCETPVEAYIAIPESPKPKQTGAYKTFTAAWNDAVAKKTDCYLNLLKDISLTNSNIAQGAQHLTPMESGKTITIQTDIDKPQAKLIIDGDKFKNFSEVFYVSDGKLVIKTGIIIEGEVSFNSVISVAYDCATLKMDEATIQVNGNLNKDLSVIQVDYCSLLEAPKVNLEFTGSRGSNQYSIYGILVMNFSTASIAIGTINGFDQAFHLKEGAELDIHEGHYQDKTVIYAENGEWKNKVLIQGGEFTGTDGYCLDSSNTEVSIEFGKFTGSLRISEDKKISSVLAPGRLAAEVDASDHITRRIPYKELDNNAITFTKRTTIDKCTAHYASKAKYYSRKTHKGNCDYCNQEGIFPHEFTDDGSCIACKVEEEVILITNAGAYEYYHTLEDAVHAIGERTDLTLKITRDMEATNLLNAFYNEEDEERKRIILDLNSFNLTLHSSKKWDDIRGFSLIIQNGTCEMSSNFLTLESSDLTFQNCKGKMTVDKELRLISSELTIQGVTCEINETGMSRSKLTIQNCTCKITTERFRVFDSKLIIEGSTVEANDSCLNTATSEVTIQTSSVKFSSMIETDGAQITVGKDGEFSVDHIDFAVGGGIHLIDNGKLLIKSGKFRIDKNAELTMSEQSILSYEDIDDPALVVLEGGSLVLSDEATITTTEELRSVVEYRKGATIKFLGGGIRTKGGTALAPGGWSGYKVTEFLAPGYAYFSPESGEELREKLIDSSVISESFVVKPHKDHSYTYFDRGDGTHQIICKLCNLTGPISPHVAQKGSNICSKCNAHFVCKHELNDEGFCKYCGLQAEACVIIDGLKSYYLSYSDAWKQAKGKTAIIRLLKDIDNVKENLVIDDDDDITIDNREFRFAFYNDISEGIVMNGGKLTISGGVFSCQDKGMATGLIVNHGEVIINGSEFKGCDIGIKVADGTLTISDGHFEVREIGLLVQGGHITLEGGIYENINNKDCIRVMENRNVKDLLPLGYYYAVPDQDTPIEIDEEQPWRIMGKTTVKQHKDHTGYWKDGVCSLCKYECTHPSFEGRRCSVCGVEIEAKLFVVYKEGDDSKRESFDHLQDALNFACQHPGSELIVSKDIPATATDKTSYTVPDEGLSVDPPIDFTIQLGKHTIGTQLFIKKARVNIKGDDGGISVSSGSALHIGVDADVRVENCNFHTDDSKLAAISIKDSKTAYLKNVHANGGYAVDASDVKDTVTLDGGYYCTASGDEESALQAVAFSGTSGTIKGCTITATAEDAAALYLYGCRRVVIDDTRLLIDDTAKRANSIRIPRRGSSETELIIENGSGIYEMASGKNITDDYSDKGKISASVDKSVYIGKAFPEKQAQIIGYEPLADIEFPAGTAIDDIIAKIPTEANAVTLNYPDKKVKVKVAFDKEEIRKAIQKVYDQEIKTLTRGENRVRTKKIDIYAKGIVSGWPEDISVVLEKTLNLRLCVEVRKYSVTLNDGQTKQEYFTGDVVELHVDGHTHGKVFSHWDVVEGEVNRDISLPDISFIMPPVNLVINAVYEDQLELVPDKAATCTKSGNKAYYICDCGQWFQSPEDAKADKPIADHSEVVIPATGHVDKDADGHCDVCREKISNKNYGGGSDSRSNGGTVANRKSGIFTGDQSNLIIWFILLTGSSLVLCVLIRKRRSR